MLTFTLETFRPEVLKSGKARGAAAKRAVGSSCKVEMRCGIDERSESVMLDKRSLRHHPCLTCSVDEKVCNMG